MPEADNGFILLDLDPATDDPALIDEALNRSRARWSQAASTHPDPATRRRAQENLGRFDTLRDNLLDQAGRRRAAEEAREIIKNTRREHQQAFHEAVQLLSRGEAAEKAIAATARRFRAFYFSENDVRELLEKLSKNSSGESAPKNLDDNIALAVKANLGLLKLASLYDFLELPDNADLQVIQQRCVRLEKPLKDLPISPLNDVKRDLLGYCNIIFKDEASRTSYQNALQLQKIQPLLELFDNCCDSGKVECRQLTFLLKKARAMQFSLDTILPMLRQKARKRRVAIAVAENIRFDRHIRCQCEHLNDPLEVDCRQCSRSLYCKCPGCGNAQLVDSMQCACGFSYFEAFEKMMAALRYQQRDLLLQLWDEAAYGWHPVFADIRRQFWKYKEISEREKARKVLQQNQIEALHRALHQKDVATLRRLWDDRLFQQNESLQAYRARIRDCLQPEDVEDLAGFIEGQQLRLNWKVQPEISQYIVCWADTAEAHQPASNRLAISRVDYQRNGCRIPIDANQRISVTVLAAVPFEKEMLLSPGDGDGCHLERHNHQKTAIFYRLQFRGMLRRRAILSLYSESDVEKLPELVLVARPGDFIPDQVSAGAPVCRIFGQPLTASKVLRREIMVSDQARPCRFRLFLARPQDRSFFNIVPVMASEMKL